MRSRIPSSSGQHDRRFYNAHSMPDARLPSRLASERDQSSSWLEPRKQQRDCQILHPGAAGQRHWQLAVARLPSCFPFSKRRQKNSPCIRTHPPRFPRPCQLERKPAGRLCSMTVPRSSMSAGGRVGLSVRPAVAAFGMCGTQGETPRRTRPGLEVCVWSLNRGPGHRTWGLTASEGPQGVKDVLKQEARAWASRSRERSPHALASDIGVRTQLCDWG